MEVLSFLDQYESLYHQKSGLIQVYLLVCFWVWCRILTHVDWSEGGSETCNLTVLASRFTAVSDHIAALERNLSEVGEVLPRNLMCGDILATLSTVLSLVCEMLCFPL